MEMKSRGSGQVNRLAPDQRAKVREWLFDGNQTYREVADRCKSEFGLDVPIGAVGTYYRREYARQAMDRFARTLDERREFINLLESRDKPSLGPPAIIRMAEFMAAEEALKPGPNRDYRKIGYLTKVIIAARREGHEGIRTAIMREKFELDFATACVIHKVKMDAIMQNDALSGTDRIQKIREEIFGSNLPE